MDIRSFSIGNAAGFIKDADEKLFGDILRSAATDVTIGSITLNGGPGNPGTTYALDENWTSVNALGLPNPGLDRAVAYASTFVTTTRTSDKNPRFSIAGFSPQEYVTLGHALSPYCDIELNLGCPNVWREGEQKPIASYNPSLMDEILLGYQTNVGGEFDVKVSPYHPDLLQEVAAVLKRYRVRRLITCNTFPNGIAFRNGKRVLDTKNGYGGVGGAALYQIMLGQVAQFKDALEGTGIKIIAAGGINSGEQMLGAMDAGASGIQVGTAFGERGARIFSDILEEATTGLLSELLS